MGNSASLSHIPAELEDEDRSIEDVDKSTGEDSSESEEEDDGDFLLQSSAYSSGLLEQYISTKEEEEKEQSSKVKKRRLSKGVIYYTDEEGIRRVLPPTMSLWYNIYVDHPCLESKRFQNKFRRRFRLPYSSYLELVTMVIDCDKFDRWKPGNTDAIGKPCAPIHLLVLCALRYLGRGWTFDDLSENTGISEEVIRVFFHRFIEFGSSVLFSKFVNSPTVVEEAHQHMHEFALAGMPGAIGSMDATHVILERVRYRLRQAHLGFKLHATARTYNIVANHRRRILSTTEGHPARWNDKTLVKFDNFVMCIYNGDILSNLSFDLYDYDAKGGVVKVRAKVN